MKILPALFVLVFWISSWFPVAPERGAVFLVVLCLLGLVAAHLAPQPRTDGVWPSRLFAFFSVAVLTIGALLALVTWAEGTSADGAIMLFFVLGFVGYLLLIRAVLAARRAYRGSGGLLLLLTALWSWTSAVAMYSHRGVEGTIDDACILVSSPAAYDTQLSAIWDMRLPEIVSYRISPSGSYIWEYHAILIAKIDGQVDHYNWSKRWARFDQLDVKRNPYLPTTCP